MSGGQPLDVPKAGGRVVVVQAKQEKVANRGFIELFGHFRMNANAIQGVAEQKKVAELCIVKGPDSEMIPGAKEVFRARIPYRKRKISVQVLHAGCSPDRIGA